MPLLPDELLDEIFLRLPPDEPACLVRASLASKLWIGLLTGPRFRARYRDFHGAPPMLGFCPVNGPEEIFKSPMLADSAPEEDPVRRYFCTTKFDARIPRDKDWGSYKYGVYDCRHGRVLLNRMYVTSPVLIIWDPMTGCRREVPVSEDCYSHAAAVLCPFTGCDHRACHQGPSLVVSVSIDLDDGDEFPNYSARTWSSEMREWSAPCHAPPLQSHAFIEERRPVLIRDGLYFMLWYLYEDRVEFLMYELGSNTLSVFDAPLGGLLSHSASIHMGMEDGSLGFAHMNGVALHLWSKQTDSDAWTQLRFIDLDELLPIRTLGLVGSVEGSDIIFVTIDLDVYEIDLKSLRWKKLCKRGYIRALIPYMSFYNPPERVSSSNASH